MCNIWQNVQDFGLKLHIIYLYVRQGQFTRTPMQQNQWEKTGLVLEKKCMNSAWKHFCKFIRQFSQFYFKKSKCPKLSARSNKLHHTSRTYVGIFKKKQDIKCMIRDQRLCLSLNVHMCFSVLRYDIKSDVTYLPFSLFSNLNNGKISTK